MSDSDTGTSSATLSPFLHHTQLRKIQSKIHRSMYTSHSTQALPPRERQAIRREIFSELQAWQRDIARLQLPSASQSSSFLHPSWYQALYHSACLMLFRPSATFPAMQGLESDQDMDDVLQMIWTSSRHVLNRYFELLRARHLNYSWVCLYTIFMAGLANVYSVGCCAQRRKRDALAFLPSVFDVVSDFRDCSNILTAIGERWHDARSSYDIFVRLSTSALKELMAATFQPRAEQITVPECQAVSQPTPGVSTDGQEREPVSASCINIPGHQSSHTIGDPGVLSNGDDALADFYSAVDFEQVFQEMQNSVNTRSFPETDEVTLGFSQEWFGK